MFSALELDDLLCSATAELGYIQPTSIQQQVIPAALEGKDILASAPTGTGKTAAFLLPALQFLLDFPRKKPGHCRILILAPTRELAIQINQHAQALSQFCDINCGVITGGINYGSDTHTLQQNPDILVATPGRLLDHIEKEHADCRDIEWLILDEADRMLDMGFENIVNQIAGEARWRKQNLLFSATLEGAGINRFARHLLNDPEIIHANPSRKEQGKIHQWIHLADDLAHKQQLLAALLKQHQQRVIVFVKTRERLEQLKRFLQDMQIPCSGLQGSMLQDKRNSALASFKQGDTPALLATDVAARGIDVDNISHVINFDLPRSADVYVHRIGRTGRAGNKGTAISLVEAHDMPILAKIERYTEQSLKRRKIAGLEPKHKEAKVAKKKKKKR
jgi:ATP-dependent RNA helicase SrmB